MAATMVRQALVVSWTSLPRHTFPAGCALLHSRHRHAPSCSRHPNSHYTPLHSAATDTAGPPNPYPTRHPATVPSRSKTPIPPLCTVGRPLYSTATATRRFPIGRHLPPPTRPLFMPTSLSLSLSPPSPHSSQSHARAHRRGFRATVPRIGGGQQGFEAAAGAPWPRRRPRRRGTGRRR
jgi:hypothetical protein